MKRIAIIDAPSSLGLRATGVSALPDTLREVGLLDGLNVISTECLTVPPRESRRDSATGLLNAGAIRAFSNHLADAVDIRIGRNEFPLVLGGDCSVLVGIAAALERCGRFGLMFVDGHTDLYSAESEPNGEVASMELSAITGRLPELFGGENGRRLLSDEDVVVLGFRDAAIAVDYGGHDVRSTSMKALDVEELQTIGASAAARGSVDAFERSGVSGYWIHVDADVLDDAIMPAVDYRMPGGLSAAELTELLIAGLSSPLAIGLDVTIYNPSLDDATRSAGRILSGILNSALVAAA